MWNNTNHYNKFASFADNIINIIRKEAFFMAKKGMRRPDPSEPHGTESNKKQKFKKNDAKPVQEIKGKAKSGKKSAEGG